VLWVNYFRGVMNLFRTIVVVVGCSVALLAGCGRKDAPKASGVPLHVRLQTDWYPQGEHGGFYYALAMGYYCPAGSRTWAR
jgi:NitT/TauT family transport system substrate-binding protein